MRHAAVLTAALFATLPVLAGANPQPLDEPITPTGETPLEEGWTMVEVSRGLMRPWAAAWLPTGEILVTEREGRLRVIEPDGEGLRPEPVSGVPEVFASGQGGLMDVVLHPEFADNRLVYFTWSAGSNGANRTTLGRARLSEDLTALDDLEVLFEAAPDKPSAQHFGSRLLFLNDGSLLMSIGDGGNPPIKVDGEFIRQKAQDTDARLGKTVRLTAEGQPHPDNPFADGGGDPYVYTLGHRNIQGLALHPDTGVIWATEHGARGGDELNVLEAGANYGWPMVTYSREYSGPRISDRTSAPRFNDPLAVWTPCIAPSGLTVYTGDAFPQWKGDLLAGGLVLKQIRRVKLEGGAAAAQTTLQFDQRIRWVGMGPDGGLYVLTDETDGGLYRIEPA